MTEYDGASITYDEIGNPLNWPGGRGMTLTWENGRQLASVVSGTNTYSYTYNADGLRTSKSTVKSGNVTKNIEYYIVNVQYIGEVTTVGGTEYVLSYFYDENGSPVAWSYLDEYYYYIKNQQGDILGFTDSEGNVVVTYEYDAWGNLLSYCNTQNRRCSLS